QDKEMLPMQEVLGEGIIQAEPLSRFLNIPMWKITKTILYEADGKLVAVMVRGDCDVNEVKVANYLKCNSLKLLAPEKIKDLTGAEVGYAGPIGLPEGTLIIADNYVNGRVNFECGANKTNYHNINVNFGRDLPYPVFGDFKLAKDGDGCPKCDGRLESARGIEVGHIFKLGTKYSEAMNCRYLDSEGKSRPVIMGCYGIGVSRIAAACVEQSHDDRGIIWPIQIAPYHVHLIGLNLEDKAVSDEAERVYSTLNKEGIETLYDDRQLRAGEKFSDADLIGIPVRLTISKRTLEQGKIEFKLRSAQKTELMSLNEAIEKIKYLIKNSSKVEQNPGV
ncbi:MAG: YbaK/EbsC family protein, partial [Verrucomicrobiia bacterium]